MLVIQIGASDGKFDYHRGVDEVYELITKHNWNGILLEPNPRHFQELLETYKNHKENVLLLEYAIAERVGEVKFFDCELDGASTLIENVLARNNYHDGKSKNYTAITVNSLDINTFLERYTYNIVPDYLVIDAEGMDGTIIEMLDFEKYPIPKIRFEFSHILMEQLGRVCLKLIKLDYILIHDKADIIAIKGCT
jgi:FkbM family methyltransferase